MRCNLKQTKARIILHNMQRSAQLVSRPRTSCNSHCERPATQTSLGMWVLGCVIGVEGGGRTVPGDTIEVVTPEWKCIFAAEFTRTLDWINHQLESGEAGGCECWWDH